MKLIKLSFNCFLCFFFMLTISYSQCISIQTGGIGEVVPAAPQCCNAGWQCDACGLFCSWDPCVTPVATDVVIRGNTVLAAYSAAYGAVVPRFGWMGGGYAGTASRTYDGTNFSGCTFTQHVYTCPMSSTPYLFANIDGKYIVENDVLSTYFHQYYEKAKELYETNAGTEKSYSLTDNYVMKLRPDVVDGKVKLKIKELEPEESHFDQVKLVRYIYDKKYDLFSDYKLQSVRIVTKKTVGKLISCLDSGSNDVLKNVKELDDKYIKGNVGEVVTAEFDVSGLRDKNIFLVLNSWMSERFPVQDSPYQFKAKAGVSIRVFFDTDGDGQYDLDRYVHPREIESDYYLYLGDIVNKVNGNILKMKLLWTQQHYLDYLKLVEIDEKEPKETEDLELVSAQNSKEGDVLENLKFRDHNYSHIVRGDEIDLEFEAPKIKLKKNQKEAYVFVSSGFYHGLRTFMYPNVDQTDSWRVDLKQYILELKQVLDSKDIKNSINLESYDEKYEIYTNQEKLQKIGESSLQHNLKAEDPYPSK